MPCVGFEPKIPASERGKIVHASDRSATVTGLLFRACSYLRMKLNYCTRFRGLGHRAGRNFPTGCTVEGLCYTQDAACSDLFRSKMRCLCMSSYSKEDQRDSPFRLLLETLELK
jgi:hypothetical protein